MRTRSASTQEYATTARKSTRLTSIPHAPAHPTDILISSRGSDAQQKVMNHYFQLSFFH